MAVPRVPEHNYCLFWAPARVSTCHGPLEGFVIPLLVVALRFALFFEEVPPPLSPQMDSWTVQLCASQRVQVMKRMEKKEEKEEKSAWTAAGRSQQRPVGKRDETACL